MPRKIQFWGVAMGIISAVTVGMVLWLLLKEILPPITAAVLVGGVAFAVGLVEVFLTFGMTTKEEVMVALGKSSDFLSETEVANTINMIRGVGDVDEFHRANPAYVGFVLRRLATRRSIESTLTRSIDGNGNETKRFAYRPWQLSPGYGIDRITGHLRNAHPSA
jgi:hypothetical protein